MHGTDRVTLADVASRAGVSRTTASYVTSGRKDMRIGADARDRVLAAAAELGYRPNLMARSLRTSVSHTIGLLSDTIASGQFAGELIHGGLDAALEHGRLLFLAESHGKVDVEHRFVRDLVDRRVDGVIYAAMSTREVHPPAGLGSLPLVLLNCITTPLQAPAVVPDEERGGEAAARALIAAGHRDGIYLVGEKAEDVLAYHDRVRGVTTGLARAGVQLSGAIDCRWWPGPAFDAVREHMLRAGTPMALICLNDRIALGAYQAVEAAGGRIPEDVSVVSFDDSPLASWLRPQLTSVALPHYELGWLAVDLLVTGELHRERHAVDMPLRDRSSVGPPRTSKIGAQTGLRSSMMRRTVKPSSN